MCQVHCLTRAQFIPKQLQQQHQRSLITITDTIIMKEFEILQELPKYEAETQTEQILLGKWSQQTCSKQVCHNPSVKNMVSEVR